MTANLILCLVMGVLGLVFILFSALFYLRKEKACDLIVGFKDMTEEKRARYDRAAIARGYTRTFAVWAAGAFVCALLCLTRGWVPFAAGIALLILFAAPHIRLWAEIASNKKKKTDRPEG